MKCTSCNNGILSPSLIDGLFRALTCNSCHGHWILIEDYVTWKERNPEFQFSDSDSAYQVEDSASAMLCPISGSIMRKFRISSKNNHRLDYSSSVGGVWLDKGEWELLKQEGLAGSLNTILTAYSQKKIRSESAKENFAAIYKDKFGIATYEKVRDLREWLNNHPQKADLRTYLLAENPYSAEN